MSIGILKKNNKKDKENKQANVEQKKEDGESNGKTIKMPRKNRKKYLK